MQAMIFAAGLGTRLHPITKNKPKALAEINGKTLLQFAIEKLIEANVSKIVINTHHFASRIEEFLINNNYFNANISISYEAKLLETAGGLAFAKKYFNQNEEIVLYNADIISNINLDNFNRFFIENNAVACLAVQNRRADRMLLFENNILCGWRNINTDEEIISREIINPVEFAFSGIHIVSPEIFDFLKPIKMSLTPFYLRLSKSKQITAYEHSNDFWFDCGKTETLKQAEVFLKKNSLD